LLEGGYEHTVENIHFVLANGQRVAHVAHKARVDHDITGCAAPACAHEKAGTPFRIQAE